tara:strand:+ start:285 stop:431 length:147 start_codon:yes stop_codon:yes gene_type:complete
MVLLCFSVTRPPLSAFHRQALLTHDRVDQGRVEGMANVQAVPVTLGAG